MMRAVPSAFQQRPKPFNGIRVYVSINVAAFLMVDNLVLHDAFYGFVAFVFVRHER